MLRARRAARCVVFVAAQLVAAAPGFSETTSPAEPRGEDVEAAPLPAAPASPEGANAASPGGADAASDPSATGVDEPWGPRPRARPPPRDPDERPDPANVDPPVFPSYRVGDAFRMRIGSRFVPSGSFDSFDVDLYRPEIRLRVTAPLSQRAALQLTVRARTSRYEFSGRFDPFELGDPSSSPFDDFYDTVAVLQAGVRLNERGLVFEDEIWSVLVNAAGRSRWEAGKFSDGLTGGGTLGIGYEIPDLIRVGIAANVRSRIDRDGVRVSPVFTLRWDITDDLTLRNRGAGGQLEYALTRRLEIFGAGFFDSDQYRLERRPGLPDDLTFRDRGVYAGLGFEWKISRHLRLNFEVGAVPWRKIRVRSRNRGTLLEEEGDASAYLDVRFELRP